MLTAAQIARLQPKEKEYTLPDTENLYLRIRPNGSRLWLIRYMVEGKARKKAIGSYPDVSLAQARALRDSFMAAVREGDLSGGMTQTFGALADEWLKRKAPTVTEKTALVHRQRLDGYILPALAALDIKQIRRPQLVKVVADLAYSGREEMARRVGQIIESVFNYALDIGVIESSPAQSLSRALPKRTQPVKGLKAATDPRDIAALMQGLDTITNEQARLALLLIAYTGVRVGSLQKAEPKEFDLERAEWRIPAEHMKTRIPLCVPLSRQAVEVVRQVIEFNRIRAPRARLMFPTMVSPERRGKQTAISEVALLRNLKNLCWSCGAPAVSIHGFRKTLSTVLNTAGWPADAIERQLAHIDGSVRGVYNLSDYMEIRRPMMQWYADYLDALRDGRPVPETDRPGL